MRKLIVFFTLVIILIVANFAFWFVHTRTITNSLDTVRKQLALKGIEFKYKEIKFINFLAWDVKAVIEKPSFKHGKDKIYSIKSVERMDLRSNPIKNEIKILFPRTMKSINHSLNNAQELLIKFATTPFIKLELFNSLATFEDAITSGNDKYGKYIKQILYFNDKFQAYDVNNENQLLYSGDNFSFWIVNNNENNTFSSGIKFTLPNLKYNPSYTPKDSKLSSGYLKQVELGTISLEADIMVYESVQSDEQENNKNKAALASKAAYNTQKVELKSVKISTTPFSIIIQGDCEKIPSSSLPFFNIKLYLKEYRNFIEYYASTINMSIDGFDNLQPLLPMKKVTDEQVNALSGLLKRLSATKINNDNDIMLEIVRTKEAATISGKPMMLVFKQLQALFFANLPGPRAFKRPEQGVEPDLNTTSDK